MTYGKVFLLQLAALLAAAFVVFGSMVVVDERERVVVTRFGDPVREITDAGLHFKRPWPFERVTSIEKRTFIYDSDPKVLPTKDKKLLVVDLFAFLQVVDGVRYLQKLDNMQAAMPRIDTVLYSELRDVIGKHDLEEVIGAKRDIFMKEIADNAGAKLAEFGIGIVLARASRTDLPKENKQAIYARMSAERASIAKTTRGEGEANKQTIVAEANREYETTVSLARSKAEKTRGEGDAEATRIYNTAFGKDPEFFRLYRGLSAARVTLGKEVDGKFILDGNEPHLKALFDRK